MKGVATVMNDLIVCSICLRVRRRAEWLDAERVISEIRSYDAELPQFRGVVCDRCTTEISRRRTTGQGALAA
jgi:hypothetical protein